MRPCVWGGLSAASAVLSAGAVAGVTRTGELSGVVLRAPIAPICMPRVPCLRPAAGIVLAFTQGGRVRARASTASDGTYAVTLQPGAYDVRVTHPAGVRRPIPASVTIAAGQAKRVTFYLDSGIR